MDGPNQTGNGEYYGLPVPISDVVARGMDVRVRYYVTVYKSGRTKYRKTPQNTAKQNFCRDEGVWCGLIVVFTNGTSFHIGNAHSQSKRSNLSSVRP